MSVSIREANIDDLDVIYEMILTMAAESDELHIFQNSLEDLRSAWGQYRCLLAIDENGDIAGFIAYTPSFLIWRGSYFYLENLFVYPQHRRNRVAKQLMERLLKIAKEENVKCVRWTTGRDNNQAIDFYKNFEINFDEKLRYTYMVI